jgi:hypothetical protein
MADEEETQPSPANVQQSLDLVEVAVKLGMSLNDTQKKALYALCEECKRLGATSLTLAPIYATIMFGSGTKDPLKALGVLKELVQKALESGLLTPELSEKKEEKPKSDFQF